MKVAIVNDVPMILAVLRKIINDNTAYEIIWTAENGEEAVQKCADETPDLILMDLIMPVMDGVIATRRIMQENPCAILIVTASVEGKADMVFEAMAAGALDAIKTPILSTTDSANGAQGLLNKIRIVSKLIDKSSRKPPKECVDRSTPEKHSCPPMIAIGSSTGGPGALSKILSALPRDTHAAVVIIQHVDQLFAEGLASWLNTQSTFNVRLARDGDTPRVGNALIAGTADHLVLNQDRSLSYSPEPQDYVYRPSVDVFFESAAKHWPGPVIGVLLTGMGKDGAQGLLSIRRRGMVTIAQNRETCAVYGMPKAAVSLNAAQLVLPIDEIAAAITEQLASMDQKQTAAGAK